jgi:hypothetical protein
VSFSFFAFFFSLKNVSLHRVSALCAGLTYIGVYYALVKTVLELRNFLNYKSAPSNGRCPVGLLYTYLIMSLAIGVFCTNGNFRASVVLYILAWALALFVSTCRAVRRPLNREASDKCFTLFYAAV